VTKVCAILSFYDESAIWLAATVASLAGVVDHLVAVDGAYALFPDGRAASPVEQRLALVETAAAARIPLTLHVPAAPWAGNEVEKRNATVELARQVGIDGWWWFVIDGDMRVARHGNLRAALAATDLDVAQYALEELCDPLGNPATERAARDGLWQKRTAQPLRGIYRADRSLRFEGAHYVVRTDNGYLWGRSDVHDLVEAADVTLDLAVEHRNRLRDYERAQQSRAYYRLRDELCIETLEAVAT
jgi:hypothetical protein